MVNQIKVPSKIYHPLGIDNMPQHANPSLALNMLNDLFKQPMASGGELTISPR